MKNNQCAICGNENAKYDFNYLVVQTLHIRDIGGERRVQALGERDSGSVCASCAAKHLGQIENQTFPVKRLAPFIGIFLLGVLISIFSIGKDRIIFMLGLAAVACGIMGCYSRLKATKTKRDEYSPLTNDEAMEKAAWEIFSESLPKKDGDNDLTYIPITEKTLAMKNGDLMIMFELLPEIAKEAWNVIHDVSE